MMTTGRIVFTLIFFILFAIAISLAYYYDLKQLRTQFGKIWQIGLAIALIVLIYYLLYRFI